jgi:hypothetical protein
MNLAHYAIKTLAYTLINLRHYGLHCPRARYPVLAFSGGSRRDCARSSMKKPSCNDTHLRIARLVAATHPVS